MKFTLTLFLLIASRSASAQYINTKSLDRFINHIETYNQSVGAISVFKNGKEVYQRNFGQPATPDQVWDQHTKYQVGSITKVFTAVLIWKLIEEGKLSLDDRLSDYYPQIANAQKISIKNLLEHSSGIKNYLLKADSTGWLQRRQVTDEEIIREIVHQGTAFEPGTEVSYSNSGYYLLKNIVEKKYGATYGELLKKKIIAPNHLKDFASADMNPTNVFNSFAYHYKDTVWQKMQDYDYRNTLGVGDIVTTPTQLNKFFFRLFQGKVVRPESLAQMIPTEKEDFGRNLMSVLFYKRTFYGHGGDTRGTHSLAVYDPENNINIAVTINGQRYPHNDLYVGLFKTIYATDTSLPYFIPTMDLERYAGVYTSAEHELKLKIFVDEHYGLMCEDLNAEAMYPLMPYKHNKLKFDGLGIDMEYKVQEMLFSQNGVKITLKKDAEKS